MIENNPNDILNFCLSRRKVIFWGSLTPEENEELMGLFQVRSAWYAAWDLVRFSHERYGIKWEGPTAWLPEELIKRTEELCRKGWNCNLGEGTTVKEREQVNREYEAAKKLPGPPLHTWP